MHRLFSASLLGALALASSASAQDVETANRSALLFNYGGLFNSTPSDLDSVGVGGRYFFDRSLAVRAAIGIGLQSSTTESDNDAIDDITNESSRLAIEGGVEYVLARTKAAYLYTGGVLVVSTSETDPEGGNNNTSGTGLAVSGLLGANYFVTDGLSIGAEYRLGLGYTSVEEQNDDTTTTTTNIGTSSFGFHLGFWFD